jgi:recombination protein RecA
VGLRTAPGKSQIARDGRLGAAIATIEQRFGHGAIQQVGATAAADIPAIPTGLRQLDCIIGVGGLPRGRIVEFLGGESAGVSTLLLHAIAGAQASGGVAALIDADLAFNPEYARGIGVALGSLFIARPDDGAMALEIVDALVRSTAFDVIAVDAVPALEPHDETDAGGGASRAARQARLLSEALRRLAAVVDRSRTVLLFGNRTLGRARNDGADDAAGGRALRFYASVRVQLTRREPIRGPLGVVGGRVDATTVKNKLAPPLRTASLELVYGKGFVEPSGAVSPPSQRLVFEGRPLGTGCP